MSRDPERWREYNRRKQAEYRRARGVPVREAPRCGTPGGYRRHQRAKERPCDACRRSWANYCRVLRERRRSRS